MNATIIPDFWVTAGHGLLRRGEDGRHTVTDAFLRAYFERPEIRPQPESGPAERALHQSLLDDPRRPVGAGDIARIEDSDGRENYRILLPFRDLLVEAGSLEAAYRRLVTESPFPLPQLFLDQIVHAILRGILDGTDNPLQARAGEIFFRPQRITVQDGQILAGDAETVERLSTTGGFGDIGRMLKESNAPMNAVDMDVLSEEHGADYWARSDRFDMVLDLTFARPGLDALCRVMEKWIAHFLALETRIHPVQSISDERWVWHSGLDTESSALLNALYRGEPVAEARQGRLLSLFRMEIKDEASVIARVRGRPVYLGLAMSADNTVRMKPQNLLVNLPVEGA
ncbi:DUF6352 family protein [Marivibrio halodurans]|uniref:DUF6352 family protein n=1 Tax=Marivibrio halodurans TaxID=2039722 RepID=UPI001FE521F6|nr:DUF6352 family protein [Marivibrio halodurans]